MAFKPDLTTRRGRALLWLVISLLRLFLGVLGRTWRFKIVKGKDVYERLLADPSPSLPALWHNRIFIGASFLVRKYHRRGRRLGMLASASRDGDLIAELGRAWGLDVVRGSSTRGGRSAMLGLLRSIRSGASPVVIPDGPVGPVYELKDGILFLSQSSKKPIVPLGFAADRAWRLRSWDRLIIPKPFARVAVAYGEPRVVPAESEGKEPRAAARRYIKEAMDEMTRMASDAVGAEFP